MMAPAPIIRLSTPTTSLISSFPFYHMEHGGLEQVTYACLHHMAYM